VESESRFVFDTNAVVSAVLLPGSVSRRALELATSRGKLLLSPPTFEELEEVLRRRRFDKYLTEGQRLRFLAALVRKSVEINVTEVVTECRDPKDNKFLELAICGKANCLVSGDQDLLVLHPFRGIPILTPEAFLSRSKNPDVPPQSEVP
jgi:putative PIN family toxin of toxin-antitoxin system